MSWYILFMLIGSISLLVAIIYLIIFHCGFKKRSLDMNYKKKPVSVVVAARNEEKYIGRLLTTLVNQSYPQELYEVIIVDDRSSDRTAQIVRQFTEKWDNIRLLQIQERQTATGKNKTSWILPRAPESISPKKYALTQAINMSSGEIILLTDADCLVAKYWIESMVSNFIEGISMVAGFSRTNITKWQKSSLLKKFEFFDFLLMFMAAAGAILSGRYFSCSNQNLAYLKSAFKKVGGFSKIEHILSGDDVNLLQLFRKHRLKVRFSLIKHSYVYTEPVDSFRQLISQRSRWASNAKWQILLNPVFFIYLTFVFLLHISILILLFFDWRAALVLFAAKMITEYIFVSSHYSLFQSDKKRLGFFPVWSLIQPFYILIVTILGVFNLFRWKP